MLSTELLFSTPQRGLELFGILNYYMRAKQAQWAMF